jgi:hypothetical protein
MAKANGKVKLHKYRVLKRIDVSTRLPDGTTRYVVHLPLPEPGEPKPNLREADLEMLGIPTVLNTDSGLSPVTLEVDLSGEVRFAERPSRDYFTQQVLEPLTAEEKRVLADYLRRRTARTIKPVLT